MRTFMPDVLTVYPSLLQALIDTLQALPEEQWDHKTLLPNWRIRDIAAHIASGALRKLSALSTYKPLQERTLVDYNVLLATISENNEKWVELLRNLHPALLISLINKYYGMLLEEFRNMTPNAKAVHAVAWAGENESENWFDISREYTELWHHQMQIEDSLGEIALLDDRYFTPFVETCFQALPYHYGNLEVDDFDFAIEIVGMSPGKYRFMKNSGKYRLAKADESEDASSADSSMRITKDVLWKLLTGAPTTGRKIDRPLITGDSGIVSHFEKMRCIMI